MCVCVRARVCVCVCVCVCMGIQNQHHVYNLNVFADGGTGLGAKPSRGPIRYVFSVPPTVHYVKSFSLVHIRQDAV